MDTETALKINTAASAIYMWREGLVRELACDAIKTIRSVSVPQIQSAIEIVEAVNRDAPSVAGIKTIRCSLDAAAIPAVKHYAHNYE